MIGCSDMVQEGIAKESGNPTSSLLGLPSSGCGRE